MMNAKTANLLSTEIRSTQREGRFEEARADIAKSIEASVLKGRDGCMVESAALQLIRDGHAEGDMETLVEELRDAGYQVFRNLGSHRALEISWNQA